MEEDELEITEDGEDYYEGFDNEPDDSEIEEWEETDGEGDDEDEEFEDSADEGETDDSEDEEDSEPEVSPEDSESDVEEEFPDYVPEELIPTTFKSAKAELEFYRENYLAVAKLGTSQAYVDHFVAKYRDLLINAEKDAEELKNHYTAFKAGNPKAYLKMHFAKELAEEGIDASLEKSEAWSIVDSRMVEKFGSDWKARFNMEDAYDAKTESGKMAMVQRQIAAEVQEHNQQAKQEAEKYKPLPPEKVQEYIDLQYEEHFKNAGFDRKTYDEFTRDIENWTPTLADLHKARYFDGYVDAAKQAAFEEGKKAASKTIASTQGKRSPITNKPKPAPQRNGIMATSAFDLYKNRS